MAILAAAVVCTAYAAGAVARDDAGDLIRRARREASNGRYAQAESTYALAARMARGEERGEALFGQAGLMRSARDASAAYERLVTDAGAGEWSQRAALELAKIHFAMGRYEAARETLRAARLSGSSDEAALFEGMADVMAGDFDAALAPLERVRRGQNRTWAMVTRAEAEAGAGREAEACRIYESLARARVNPAAWYRHAECLEAAGDSDGARQQYAALAEAYPQTPEAIRCAGKLSAQTEPPVPPRAEEETSTVPPGKGYTIQFGSFTDRANAIRLSSRIKETFPGVRIDSELVNYREVFRVRIGYYASRDEAETAAQDMAKRLDERYTIMPVRPNP
jgi:tetratricopeptide (TPR) repeat protein